MIKTTEIKSTISIEFGLNISEARNIVDNIFRTISECLNKSNCIEIEKFGKFKSAQGKIRFIPSKKFSNIINYNFTGLKEIELQIEKYTLKEKPLTCEELEKKFLKEGIIKEKEESIVQRKLIPDDVVKLHNEITKEKQDGKKNIWG